MDHIIAVASGKGGVGKSTCAGARPALAVSIACCGNGSGLLQH